MSRLKVSARSILSKMHFIPRLGLHICGMSEDLKRSRLDDSKQPCRHLLPGLFGILICCVLILIFVCAFNNLTPTEHKHTRREILHSPQPAPECNCEQARYTSQKAKDILERLLRIRNEMIQFTNGHIPTRADDPKLVSFIRDNFIDPPRPFMTKFSLPLFQTDQAKAVDAILNQKRNGFFVECGGLDGERSSNTLWLEQKRGWNGLLIEMDPSYYLQIRGKNRKCFSINACLSLDKYPALMPFKEHAMGEGQIVEASNEKTLETYCFPFLSMMLALNVTRVDYFSLDVEGYELDILRTIPFDRIDISVLTVEFVHGPDGGRGYESFMRSKGYRLHSTISSFKPEIYYGANDYVFVKN